jgi:transposase InsO family protein
VSAYRLVSAEKARTPVSVACELLGVSRSGYYAWAAREPSQRDLSDAALIGLIREIHTSHRQVYGSRRMTAELRLGHGLLISRKRVQRLMRQAQISGLVARKRGKTTIRVPGVRVADDLVERRFRPGEPNVLWVTDITYLRTWEGWVYLAAVQDAYSRRIVGWSMADHMRAELVVDALQMALARRRPAPGLIHHSDQGSQFVSLGFGQAARDAGIAQSMGSKGDAYDNAVAESFFATLKKELVRRRSWPARQELISEVFDYIEGFYNTVRRHSTPGLPLTRPVREDQSLKQPQQQRLGPQAPDCPQNRVHSNPCRTAGRGVHANRLAGIVRTTSESPRPKRHVPEAQTRLSAFAKSYGKREAELEARAEKLREERDAAIRAAHKEGLPMATIAQVLGISHQRVSQIVRS